MIPFGKIKINFLFFCFCVQSLTVLPVNQKSAMFSAMIGFLFKKSFFDGYDNFWGLFLLNVLYGILVIGLAFTSFILSSQNLLLLGILVLISFFVISFYAFGAYYFFYKWSNYEQGRLKECISCYKGNLSIVLEYTAFLYLTFFLIPVAQYVYLSSNQLVSYLIAFFLVGVEFVNLLTVQFFLPICYYSDFDRKSALKQCVAYAFDNLGCSLFLLLRSTFDLALTIVSFGIIPGLGGIGISRTDTVRLLTERYQYLESNPGILKKEADINEMFAEDIESTGKRTLRNMIFPWKDA